MILNELEEVEERLFKKPSRSSSSATTTLFPIQQLFNDIYGFILDSFYVLLERVFSADSESNPQVWTGVAS